MYVNEWMSQSVITVNPGDSVYEAQQSLLKNRIRHLPVVTGEGELIGVVSQTDLQAAVVYLATAEPDTMPLHSAIQQATIAAYMTKPAITIEHHATVEEGAALMRKHRVGCLPVVRSGKLVGILTETDLFDVLVEALGMEAGGARMVFDLVPGKELKAFDRALEWLQKDRLVPSCVASYRARSGDARLLIRAEAEKAVRDAQAEPEAKAKQLVGPRD